jgi:hypothetical protein
MTKTSITLAVSVAIDARTLLALALLAARLLH